MNFEQFIEKIKNLSDNYYSELNKIRDDFVRTNREFQNGDLVNIDFWSPEYGDEKEKGFVRRAGLRGDDKIAYHFNKVRKDGKESKFPLILPKGNIVKKVTLRL